MQYLMEEREGENCDEQSILPLPRIVNIAAARRGEDKFYAGFVRSGTAWKRIFNIDDD